MQVRIIGGRTWAVPAPAGWGQVSSRPGGAGEPLVFPGDAEGRRVARGQVGLVTIGHPGSRHGKPQIFCTDTVGE